TTATIQPKKYQQFDIKFLPLHEKVEKAVIQFKTMFNPYENPKWYLSGEGFFEAVSIDKLENDNELKFGDVCVNETKELQFTLINHSENHFRFNWINNLEPSLLFSPSQGFLLSKTQKEITVTFTSKESVKHIWKDWFIELKQIKFTENGEQDWDNAMTTIKKVTLTEQENIWKKRAEDLIKRKEENEMLINQLTNVKGGKVPPKKDPKKANEKNVPNPNVQSNQPAEEANIDIEEIVNEPQTTIVDKSEKYLPIKLTVVSDFAKYQCSIKEIRFKPTVMFGTRKFDFQLRNTSMVALSYKFSFSNPNPINNNATHLSNNNLYTSYDKSIAQQDNLGGAFSIAPPYGTIPALSDEIISIRFSPIEIDEFFFKRFLTCNIKDLDPSLSELKIELSGDAERPLCHFEIESGI
ncbi:MAG: hypothetical protein ACRC42_04790, partial [Mycoplasma sp.]